MRDGAKAASRRANGRASKSRWREQVAQADHVLAEGVRRSEAGRCSRQMSHGARVLDRCPHLAELLHAWNKERGCVERWGGGGGCGSTMLIACVPSKGRGSVLFFVLLTHNDRSRRFYYMQRYTARKGSARRTGEVAAAAATSLELGLDCLLGLAFLLLLLHLLDAEQFDVELQRRTAWNLRLTARFAVCKPTPRCVKPSMCMAHWLSGFCQTAGKSSTTRHSKEGTIFQFRKRGAHEWPILSGDHPGR